MPSNAKVLLIFWSQRLDIKRFTLSTNAQVSWNGEISNITSETLTQKCFASFASNLAHAVPYHH